jgi:hypothetical protein
LNETLQLNKAQYAADNGNKTLAKNLVDAVILNNPGSEEAWLMLSKLVDNPEEEADCLRRAVSINPGISTKMRLAELERDQVSSTHTQPSKRDKIWNLLERGPLETPNSNPGSRNNFSDLLTWINDFFASDFTGKIEKLIQASLIIEAVLVFMLLSVWFSHASYSGFFQNSITYLSFGFVVSSGLWIWRIVIKKESIPSAEMKLLLYAGLYLAGLAIFIATWLANRNLTG